jgi:malonyl CoA-acyl carrier protein transacylase
MDTRLTEKKANRLEIILDENIYLKLKPFCENEATTPFIASLAAFKILLQRYTEQDNIIVDVLSTDSVELQTSLTDNPTVKALLTRLNQTVTETPTLPIKLAPRRLPFEVSKIGTTEEEITDVSNLEIQNDLVLLISEQQGHFSVECEYNAQLFEPALIERMLGHFQSVLSGIIASPNQAISTLPLLTPVEQHQMLVEWNETQQNYPHKCFHQLFEEQVTRTPDAVAVVFKHRQLTYRELNQRANKLAHYLLKNGVEPEMLVGICIERSLDMLIGLLGILKAGGAYVPLDPTYPKDRLSYMLEDANVHVLLTHSTLVKGHLSFLLKTENSKERLTIISLDTDKRISQQSQDNPFSGVLPENLAYTIYTSGSTGKPKGVQIPHCALVNFLNAMRQSPGLTDKDTLLAVTTISFDIAGLELYLPLTVGAKIVLASHDVAASGQLLGKLIKSSGTTVMQATPATWYLLLAAKWEGNPQLKILIGGEALPKELANQLLDKVGSVWNMYGPTEATIWSTIYQVPSVGDLNSETPESIGRPIANTQIYILNSHLQPVPIGVAGELHIGGAGLARGYRHRPELTNEKFIANPFDSNNNRLYKTGDLARYLPDGNIEFLGRIDHQVKVHGFRIELGEIEAVLNRHPAVHQSVVVVQKSQVGGISGEDKRLVAYAVPDPHYQGEEESEESISDDEQVSQWQQLWDMAYQQPDADNTDPTFNISGWNDSYTGAPIPVDEMREWVDTTVAHILSACQPQRVLEIGCGTGMLLFRIAPHCDHYCGSDIAPTALRYIDEQMDKLAGDWSHVTLRQGSADNFEDLKSGEFDTLIINSVVQLFPSIDYLVDVLEKAIQLLKPGGSIFIGDVRSLPLLEAFHAAVQLCRVPDELALETLRYRVQKNLVQEGQMAIDPDFFHALKQHLPQITHVEIQLRQGRAHNEMTKFRYDAVLHLNKEDTAVEPHWLDWQKDNLTLSSVQEYLTDSQPQILGIKNVPNARLTMEMKLLECLETSAVSSVAELQQALQQIDGIEPDDWWHLNQDLAYTIFINWSDQQKGCYDVVFQQGETRFPRFSKSVPSLELTSYANNPLQGQIVSKLEPALRRYLKEHLPDYMVPTAFVILDEMPLTPNGKVNRRALPLPEKTRPALSSKLALPQSGTEQMIAKVWKEVLQLEVVGIHDNFFELGGNSLHLTQVHNQLTDSLESELSVVRLFQYPTIHTLAQHITQPTKPAKDQKPSQKVPKPVTHTRKVSNDIAIIGLSGRFPGASDIEAFWHLLRDGVESITFFADNELEVADPSLHNNPNYVKAGAPLSDIDQFDASFFGYSAREAEMMDPQHRLFLECAWEALENAGYNPETYQGLIGVYAGSGMNTYLMNNVHPHRHLARTFLESASDLQVRLANGTDFLTTRVSYKLNLTGPSVNIQTACSTSLVAVHSACQSLRNGECNMALAGGISITVPQKVGYLYQEDMICSPDGHCRAFDAKAQGTVFGSGGGIVVLKLLSQALEDGDQIHAVIKGSAINNDGALKVGYTAPSVEGQTQVISEALANAHIEPHTISYIEAHGTGTKLGDPIEVAALTQAFRQHTAEKGFCAIGSVKTNMGHLVEASGITGLIKTVLALKHKSLPPSLHFNQANPGIDFANSPFYVNTALSEWKTTGIPRRAGVSSFGMGGTNAHVILEEAPKPAKIDKPSSKDRPLHLLSLSAKSEPALQELAQRYVNYLKTDTSLADICFTAHTGRKHFEHRLTVVAASSQQLQEQLQAFSPATVVNAQPKKIAFLFTGQGSQYVGMGQQLYHTQPTFRQALNRCDEILRPYLDKPLLEVLYPDKESTTLLDETAYTQPALFALEYALYQLWTAWGIKPDVVMGHSVGEYVAACVAGVFSLEDGLKLIAERSRLMQALPQQNGEMVSLLASEQQVRAALESVKNVSIAAINGPNSIVISGQRDAINTVCNTGIKTKKLTVSHAFHSPLMEPILADFEQVAQQVRFYPPQIQLISNVTGELATDDITTPAYWCRHILKPVKFAASMDTIAQLGVEIFQEIGPKPILLGMGRECLPDSQGLWLPSLRSGTEDWQQLLTSLGELYKYGVSIDWLGFDRDYVRHKVSLPTYPFQRQRYWVEAPEFSQIAVFHQSKGNDLHPLLGQRISLPGSQEIRFQSLISPDSPRWLKDHRVFETAIMPGAGYLEMALAAGTIILKSENVQIEDVVFQQALPLLENEVKRLQVVLTPTNSDNYSFEIYSLDSASKDNDSWICHTTGKLTTNPQPHSSGMNLSELKRQCSEQMSVDTFYHMFKEQGLEYGPNFRAVDKIWRQEGVAAIGKIGLPKEVASELEAYKLHPATLDACLHLLGATYSEEEKGKTYLPIGVERLQIYRSPSYPKWSYAKLSKGKNADILSIDLHLFDESEALLATIEGLQLKYVNPSAVLGASQWKNWLYTIAWQSQVRKATPAIGTTKNWVIFTDNQGIGIPLSERLRAQGETCTLVYQGQTYEQLDEHGFCIDSAMPEHFQQLFKHLPSVQGVIHLWSLDAPTITSTDAIEKASQLSCGSTLYLVQTLVRTYLECPALWLVTRGVQTVGETLAVPAVEQSSLWGMGKVIGLEHPELNCVRVDLDPNTSHEESAKTLFEEVLSSPPTEQVEDQVAFRDDTRYVARLVRSRPFTDEIYAKPFQLDISQRGTLDNLQLLPTKRRQPSAGEVEIQIRATGLNFIDVLDALGALPFERQKEFGAECAGEIVAIGEGVEVFKIGEPVLAIAFGSFSKYVTVNASLVAPIPNGFSFEEAASIPVNFLTAYYALHHIAKISAGDKVLIHAAAGGTGMAAVKVALQAGAVVFGTASPTKWKTLHSLGVQYVYNSRTLDFAEQVMADTQDQGVDIILNSLTGEGFIEKSLSVLARGGRFLEIAKRDVWDEEQVEQFKQDISYHFIDLRQMCLEQADLIKPMLHHISQLFVQGELKLLPRKSFPIQNVVGAFRYMQKAKHIGKIVVTQPAMNAEKSVTFREDSRYLITGGLGDLGLLIARWMVECGARHLVLVGRRPPNDSARSQLENLEQLGASVNVTQADISVPEQVAQILAEKQPLRGIIHAAGVLDDGIMTQINWEHFASVMAPKVKGAWNLHTLTQNQPLDFFVSFSSIASLLGSAAQANYAAANAFLDTFTYYRQAQGLPALSINWGPWAEIGMASRTPQVIERLNKMGMGAIAPEQGLQIFEKLFSEPLVSQIGVIPIKWAQFRQEKWAASPFFTDFVAMHDSSVEQPVKLDFLKQLEKAPANQYRELLIAHVCVLVAKTLGLGSPTQIEREQRLIDLGLDSLMAIELRSHLQSSLKCSLRSTLLFDYPTVETLVDYLLSEVITVAKAESQEKLSSQYGVVGKDAYRSTLVTIQPQGSKQPLFFVPGILGNVFYLERLAHHLGLEQPFYGLRSLGLDEDIAPYTKVEEIAAHHIKAIQTVQPHGPYLIGGHSFGGKVAFEIAHQLKTQGEVVSLLAIVDIQVGVTESAKAALNWGNAKYIANLADDFERTLDTKLGVSFETLQSLNPEEQHHFFQKQLKLVGQTTYTDSELRRLLQVYQANTQAMIQYVLPANDLIPITLLRAEELTLGYNFLPDETSTQADSTWGWSQLSVAKPLAFYLVPGNHFSMMMEPHVQVLADKLKVCLDSVHPDTENS